MSKTHKHDDDCNCKDINALLGTRLFNKLYEETVQSADNTERDLTKLAHAALAARKGLIADELPASLSEEDRKLVLSEFVEGHVRRLICSFMRIAVTMSVSAGDTIPEYISHAAKHWDDELLQKVAVSLSDMAATRIQKAAAAQTGEHN